MLAADQVGLPQGCAKGLKLLFSGIKAVGTLLDVLYAWLREACEYDAGSHKTPFLSDSLPRLRGKGDVIFYS
jgi:hypothetical protein